MMQYNNKVIIAAAGSGKTTFIAKESISKDEKILILTYTNENLNEIRKKIIELQGVISSNITIRSWFSFLLSDGVRPYQNFLYDKQRINNICFTNSQSTRFIKKENIEKYYLKNGEDIYTDKISLFVKECNEKSNSAVINRLEAMFDKIYIDEVQDLSGYDLELLELLFKSKIEVILVGDIRQATYSTNNAPKNKKYIGNKIYDYFKFLEKKKMCTIIYRNECYRCNQSICDFADSLYPELEKSISKNNENTGHDGIFIINSKDISEYMRIYNPQVLRYDKNTKFDKDNVLNFGQSKGLTFNRVLIIPNGPIKKFLKTGDYLNIKASKAKIYVAFTRARYSVAILYDDKCLVDDIRKLTIK